MERDRKYRCAGNKCTGDVPLVLDDLLEAVEHAIVVVGAGALAGLKLAAVLLEVVMCVPRSWSLHSGLDNV